MPAGCRTATILSTVASRCSCSTSCLTTGRRQPRWCASPGLAGVLGAAAWDFAGGLPTHRMFYDTAAVLDPEAGFRMGFARPLQRRGELAALWSECGLSSVQETALTIWMEFRDFADYWAGWTWAQNDYLRHLSDSASTRLMEYVRAAYLSEGPDGPRAFTATAWAVRGVRF